ncbi:MAG: HAD family hydrolase [Pseudonocardia sp.]
MKAPVRAVIFDLDGTLVQTRVASWDVFARVNERFGLGVDSPDEYFDLFRGNVFASIRERCRDEAHAAEVKGYFMQLLRDEYTPPLVPGVSEVVRRLAGSCTLAVMSSNATAVLRRVLEAGGLAFCFAHVFGGDVMPDKRAAISAFLADSASGFGRRCSADYDETGPRSAPDHEGTVLVTDTAGDVRDAREAGIRAVGVAWGMHSVAELTDAGAEFVALWPQEIAAHLLGDAAAHPPAGACAVPGGSGAGGGCDCGCSSARSCGGPGTGADVARSHAHDAELARAARARRDRRRAAADRVATATGCGTPDSGAPGSSATGGSATGSSASGGSATGGGARRAADDELLAAIRRLVRP